MKNIPKHAGDAKNWSFPHFKKFRKSGRHYFKYTVYSSTTTLYKVKNKNKLNPHPTFLPLIVEFCRQNLGSSSSLQALHGKIRTSTPIAHMSENDHLKISITNLRKMNIFFLHIRLDLVEFAGQMVLFLKFRVDTAENEPKQNSPNFTKIHEIPVKYRQNIL